MQRRTRILSYAWKAKLEMAKQTAGGREIRLPCGINEQSSIPTDQIPPNPNKEEMKMRHRYNNSVGGWTLEFNTSRGVRQSRGSEADMDGINAHPIHPLRRARH